MSHGDTSHRSADAENRSGERDAESLTDRLPVSDLPDSVQKGDRTGMIAGAGGGVLAIRGLRRFRQGARIRGLLQAVVGGALLAVAVARRRSGRGQSAGGRGIDQTDVVDTAPDLEGISSSDTGSTGHASGEEAADAVDTTIDIEDAATPPEDRDEDHASGDEAADVVGTSTDIEDAVSDDAETTEDESTEDADTDAGWSTADETESGDDETDSADAETDAGDVGGEMDQDEDDGATETDAETDSDVTEGDEDSDEEAEAEEDTDEETETGAETDEETEAEQDSDDDVATDGGVADETGEADGSDERPDESYDRLGAAAFDDDTNQLPAPQRAFNQSYLALGAEAVWGIREADDAVVVSQLYDPIEDRDDMRYVGTSKVDNERVLAVPDDILNHWDEVAGGGTAVVSGDDLVFATSDDLKADSLLVVVPEQWTADVFGDDE